MTLMLRVLEDTDLVCIVGSGISGGRYLVVTQVLEHTILQDLAADRSGLCSMFFKKIILPVNHHHVMMD